MARTLVFSIVLCALCGAEIPPINFIPRYPFGFQASLPDDGYSRFIFQGILTNSSTMGVRWLEVLSAPINGIWVFQDNTTLLFPEENIHYKVFVTKNGVVHKKEGIYTIPRPTKMFNSGGASGSFGQNYGPQSGHSHGFSSGSHSCRNSLTELQRQPFVCAGELLFSEDFDKEYLHDLYLWYPETKFPEQPDYVFNVYQQHETLDMLFGSFLIKPVALEEIRDFLDLSESCTGRIGTRQCKQESSGALVVPPIMTGKITTRSTFNFKYGRVEISAKMPSGHWLIPELNLEPTNSVYGPDNYASGVIRIASTIGTPNMGKKLYGGPILSDEEPYRSYFLREVVGEDEWSRTFHNYTLIWAPDGIELFVDGVRYGTVSPGFAVSGKEYQVPHADGWHKDSSMAPLDEYFYLSIGLRVGGVHDFPDSPDKPWKNRSTKAMLEFWNNRTSWLPSWNDSYLLVDYVRVYAL